MDVDSMAHLDMIATPIAGRSQFAGFKARPSRHPWTTATPYSPRAGAGRHPLWRHFDPIACRKGWTSEVLGVAFCVGRFSASGAVTVENFVATLEAEARLKETPAGRTSS